jgi:hypothetical protein
MTDVAAGDGGQDSSKKRRCFAGDSGIPENHNDENAASNEAPAAMQRSELENDNWQHEERECSREDAKQQSHSPRSGHVSH